MLTTKVLREMFLEFQDGYDELMEQRDALRASALQNPKGMTPKEVAAVIEGDVPDDLPFAVMQDRILGDGKKLEKFLQQLDVGNIVAWVALFKQAEALSVLANAVLLIWIRDHARNLVEVEEKSQDENADDHEEHGLRDSILLDAISGERDDDG